jgi:hypothetical protein
MRGRNNLLAAMLSKCSTERPDVQRADEGHIGQPDKHRSCGAGIRRLGPQGKRVGQASIRCGVDQEAISQGLQTCIQTHIVHVNHRKSPAEIQRCKRPRGVQSKHRPAQIRLQLVAAKAGATPRRKQHHGSVNEGQG